MNVGSVFTPQRAVRNASANGSPTVDCCSLAIQRAGGARPPTSFSHEPVVETPAAVRLNQKAGTPEGYRKAAIAEGITVRPEGLFPDNDATLIALANNPNLHPFQKHLPGAESPYESLPEGGWITGNEASVRGIDLRLFFQEPVIAEGEDYGKVLGCVRFGDGAAIGSGANRFYLTAHGGAIETVLDEATAEIGKMCFAPFLSTVEATFRIKKPVPLHTTLMVQCTVTQQRGIRLWVTGTIMEAEDQGSGVLAQCDAVLVNMVPFIKD